MTEQNNICFVVFSGNDKFHYFFPSLDNGGIRQAFNAYRVHMSKSGQNRVKTLLLPGLPGLSQDQLFFVGYTSMWCENTNYRGLIAQLNDVHPPNPAR